MVELRWVALLPDPVTGLDQPVRNLSGQPMIWVAVDLETARKQVKAALLPAAFRLASVISALDWETRKRERQRPKLSAEPKDGRSATNRSQRCQVCGSPTFSPYARLCDRHRRRGRSPRKPQDGHAATSPALTPPADD